MSFVVKKGLNRLRRKVLTAAALAVMMPLAAGAAQAEGYDAWFDTGFFYDPDGRLARLVAASSSVGGGVMPPCCAAADPATSRAARNAWPPAPQPWHPTCARTGAPHGAFPISPAAR